jgi:pantothenate kinase
VLDNLITRVRQSLADRAAHPGARPADRLIVGIAGPPGAGKTTLAHDLCAALPAGGHSAAVVPMDGFHLANVELRRLGRADRKGAPDTFDADGYVALLRRLRARSEAVVYAPSFDHVMDEPIAGSIPVPCDVQVIITEGNYLLLDGAAWSAVRGLLDLAVYVDVASAGERVAGLIERQVAKGLDPQAAADWVHRSDEANARLIATTRSRADIVVTR